MSIILSDAGLHQHLRPLTTTRPVGQIRPGILRISEGWYVRTGLSVGYRTEHYMSEAFPLPQQSSPTFEVNGSLFPSDDLVAAVLDLRVGQALVQNGKPLAYFTANENGPSPSDWTTLPPHATAIEFNGNVIAFERPWHLFQQCGTAIEQDIALLTEGRRSQRLSAYNTVVGDPNQIFLEEGAIVEASILNTKNGPIYIGKDAEVMEGCMIRGPFALGDHSQLKMGAKIYGPTTVGPESRVGGEVNNCVMTGFSNKGHDGFLGNSVIGEWCNLGADTNNSNLKNTYGNVQAYSYAENKQIDTGLQFCGLIMGDHSKSGINTMFNTGTVVGVGANVYGSGFPPKHIPDLVWGGAEGFMEHEIERAIKTAKRVMERRNIPFTKLDEGVLRFICGESRKD